MEHRLPFVRSPFDTLAKLQGALLFVVIVLLLLAPLAIWLKGSLIVAALALCVIQVTHVPRCWSELGEFVGLRIDRKGSRICLEMRSVGRGKDTVDCRVAYHSAYLIILVVKEPSRGFQGALRWPLSRRLPVFASSLSRDDFRRLSAAAFTYGDG